MSISICKMWWPNCFFLRNFHKRFFVFSWKLLKNKEQIQPYTCHRWGDLKCHFTGYTREWLYLFLPTISCRVWNDSFGLCHSWIHFLPKDQKWLAPSELPQGLLHCQNVKASRVPVSLTLYGLLFPPTILLFKVVI